MQETIRVTFDLNRSTKKSQNLSAGNEMINSNDRLHYRVRAELTRHLREKANLEGRQYIGDLPEGTYLYSKKEPCHIIVYACPPTNRKMDAPNWYPTVKPLIDGLVDMGMFEDDNDQVITSYTFLNGGKTGTKQYRIILEVRPGRFPDNRKGETM